MSSFTVELDTTPPDLAFLSWEIVDGNLHVRYSVDEGLVGGTFQDVSAGVFELVPVSAGLLQATLGESATGKGTLLLEAADEVWNSVNVQTGIGLAVVARISRITEGYPRISDALRGRLARAERGGLSRGAQGKIS